MPLNSALLPGMIGKMLVKNRFVRSATHEGLADADGVYTEKLVEYLKQLAAGGVGLIITGHAYVSAAGNAGNYQASADSDAVIPAWSKMLDVLTPYGVRCVLQLAHAGAYAANAETAIAPMAIQTSATRCPAQAASLRQLQELPQYFAEAAVRAREAGFHGVQIHAAHGYLISEFLSGAYNQRTDGYGGSLEKRARLLLEIVRAVREAVGPDYPLLVKINSEDFAKNGMSNADCAAVCKMLQEKGVSAIELSGGVPLSPAKYSTLRTKDLSVYYREAARAIRQELGIPVILTGGVRSLRTAGELIDEKACDFVGMSRPFIREPGIVEHWKEDGEAVSDCISCNRCFRSILVGKGVACAKERSGK